MRSNGDDHKFDALRCIFFVEDKNKKSRISDILLTKETGACLGTSTGLALRAYSEVYPTFSDIPLVVSDSSVNHVLSL